MYWIKKKIRQFHKAATLLRRPLWRRALYGGTAASIEHLPVLQGLHFNTVVDIGANIGQFSLLIRELNPDANIHAFEPLSSAADRFKAVFSRDPRTVLHSVAIAPLASTQSMHVSRSLDSSSLLPISTTQVELFPGTEEVRSEQITTARLDQILTRDDIKGPALLKMDVQGYEVEVIKGCLPLLDCFSHLYVEVSFMQLYENQPLADDIIKLLHANGYALRALGTATFSEEGRSIQADLLFSRQT